MRRIIFATLVRARQPRRVVVDALALIGVGLLASFIIMFISRPYVDNVIFELGMNYSTRAEVAPGHGEISVTEHVTVSAPLDHGNSHSEPVFFDSTTADLWHLASEHEARELLHFSGLHPGTLSPPATKENPQITAGIWLDRNSAHMLNVVLGDTVYVTVADSETPTECPVEVTGLVRSYHDLSSPGAGGVVILPHHACPDVFSPDFSLSFNTETGVSPGGKVLSMFREQANNSTVTGIICLIALALWTLLVRRTWRSQQHDSAPTHTVLDALGASPRRVATLSRSILVILMVPCALMATLVSRWLVDLVANFYIQPLHALLTVGALVILGLLTTLRRLPAQEIPS